MPDPKMPDPKMPDTLSPDSLAIAVIIGSLRAQSHNRRLADILLALPPAQSHRFTVVPIDALPLYNQDEDNAPRPSVLAFKTAISAADGILFVTPEYNRSIPGVLKNAIDHGSRPPGHSAWLKKPAGIIGISPGAAGTAMSQQHLRNVLASLDMPTLGQPEAFMRWDSQIYEIDASLDERTFNFLTGWLTAFLAHVARYAKAAPT